MSMFEVRESDGSARTGALTTRRGIVETPFFMPVLTRSSVGRVGPDEYSALGATTSSCRAADVQAVICNSLIAAFLPGVDRVHSAGGVHGLLDFSATIFTDSGGYQVAPGSSFDARVGDEGIFFKAHWNAAELLLTPQESMNIQQCIGSDAALALDDMVVGPSARERCIDAMERTHRWAEMCARHHSEPGQLLFGICQGGPYEDLRVKSAKFIDDLGFSGVALGGIAMLSTQEERLRSVRAALRGLAPLRPRYVMGIGHPLDVLEMVAAGIDCFDAAFPTLLAKRGICLTSRGMLDVGHSPARLPAEPIDRDCRCRWCVDGEGRPSAVPASAGRGTGSEWIADHNVAFMARFMSLIRDAIRERRFESFRRRFIADWR
jgi:queuine tRNA-ribosyltransferase